MFGYVESAMQEIQLMQEDAERRDANLKILDQREENRIT
jgi:hypothetical protein